MGELDHYIAQLRKFRENNARNSSEVLEIWANIYELIKPNVDKLSKEKGLILEQVCIAALDCFHTEIARFCLKHLLQEFPNSLRVKKYEAMILEAEERYDEALKLLDSIIKVDSTNSAARKRRVAVLKAQGKNADAIKELVDYLKIFMADFEGWQELCDLYIIEQDFSKAAFCMEELILHNPHNHLLHQRYADIRYSQGGLENVELARSYYSQAVKLNPNNMRALYGLYWSSSSIAVSPKITSNKKKEALKVADWALAEIKKKYENVKERNANIEERLAALQLN